MPQAGARTDANGNAVHNKIPRALPDREFDELRPHLEFVQLQYHRNIYESTVKIDYPGFLNRCTVSLVASAKDRRSVQVGVVGRAGGVSATLAAAVETS